MDRIRAEIRRIIYGEDEFETRFRFVKVFEGEIHRFTDRIAVAVQSFESLHKHVDGSQRRAYAAAFLWNALNDLTLSMRLLLSGYQVPSGALMRQYSESIAMSLLVSDPHSIQDLSGLDKYPVHKAVQCVGHKKVAARLDVDRERWLQFQKASEAYDNVSHPSTFALVAGSMVLRTGSLLIGGIFDKDRTEVYKKEIGLRISAAERAIDTGEHLIKIWNKIPAQ